MRSRDKTLPKSRVYFPDILSAWVSEQNVSRASVGSSKSVLLQVLKNRNETVARTDGLQALSLPPLFLLSPSLSFSLSLSLVRAHTRNKRDSQKTADGDFISS